MQLSEQLHIQKGVTCLIGGGGKTTLLYTLAEELGQKGTVILGTSTKIYPPKHVPVLLSPTIEQLQAQLKKAPVVCVGTLTETGKLTDCGLSMNCFKHCADFVLLEADGSAGLPFKAHRAHEPVIPSGTDRVILVLGASGFGQSIGTAAHCPQLYSQLCGAEESDSLTPELAVNVVKKEHLHDTVFVNQVETAYTRACAMELGRLLACPVVAGSLQKGAYVCLR